MGKSAYAPCGQAASVGVPVGCVRITKIKAALHPHWIHAGLPPKM